MAQPARTLLDHDRIDRARLDAQQSGKASYLDALVDAQAPDADRVGERLAAALGMRWLGAAELARLSVDFDLVPFVEASGRQCAAFSAPGTPCLIATADPLNESLRLWIEQRLQQHPRSPVHWAVVGRDTLVAYLRARERDVRIAGSAAAALPADGADDAAGLTLSVADLHAADSPLVRLVNATIIDALNADASDIHLESDSAGLTVKYRIDGVLVTHNRVPGTLAARQFISRLKVLSELDIAEQRIPQDGRLSVALGDRTISLRVSIMPNLHGEDAVLRVLDRRMLAGDAQALSIEMLGLDERDAVFARRMARRPHGLFLVTGPTGSGKTTTLYALLQEINHGLEKIVTIEDPIEYELKGVLQIPVNEAKGLTFARGLRSILRHDPDKVMVGEIRDADTATIAVQAALTGHQVFATVHANNVIDVVGRLTSMGTDAYNLAAALNGVLAQRLVRLNCPACAEPFVPDAQLLDDSGLSPGWPEGKPLQRSAGCVQCRGSGYRGRRAVVETLAIDGELRAMVSKRAPLRDIRVAARERGLQPLREAALALVAQGRTTLEEVNRVTTKDDDA